MSGYKRLASSEEDKTCVSKFKPKHRQSGQVLSAKVAIGFLLGFLTGLMITYVKLSYTSNQDRYKNYSPGDGLPLIGTRCLPRLAVRSVLTQCHSQ